MYGTARVQHSTGRRRVRRGASRCSGDEQVGTPECGLTDETRRRCKWEEGDEGERGRPTAAAEPTVPACRQSQTRPRRATWGRWDGRTGTGLAASLAVVMIVERAGARRAGRRGVLAMRREAPEWRRISRRASARSRGLVRVASLMLWHSLPADERRCCEQDLVVPAAGSTVTVTGERAAQRRLRRRRRRQRRR